VLRAARGRRADWATASDTDELANTEFYAASASVLDMPCMCGISLPLCKFGV
jgi:hypothetical protein